MKTIKVKKSIDFSESSKLLIHIGNKKLHIKGFESFSLPVNPGEEVYASHLWTGSNRISYDQIKDGDLFLIRPRLGKQFAFINLVIFMICFVIFHFTKSRWSFFPLLPTVMYAGLYITILKNKYLIIELIKQELT
jgi:hypothetical protein